MGLTFKPTRIGHGTTDEEGMIVTEDGSLVAVLSRVPHDQAGIEGEWYIECGFPDELGSRETFNNLEDVAAWLSARSLSCC